MPVSTLAIEDISTSYKFYRTYAKKPKHRDIYRPMVGKFLKLVVDKILEGYEVQLSGGESLGSVAVRGYKQKVFFNEEGEMKGRPIDWKATKEFWLSNPEEAAKGTKIFHFNDHSNGITYNIVWLTHEAKLRNKSYYTFKFGRRFLKNVLAANIKEGKEYLVYKRNKYIHTPTKKFYNGTDTNKEDF